MSKHIIVITIRITIFLFFFLFSYMLFPLKVNAAVLFSDNFDNGASQWTPLSGSGLWQVKEGKYGALINAGSTIIISAAGNVSTPNYRIEMDMYPVQGVDRNVEFRWRNGVGASTGIHFVGDQALFYAHNVADSEQFSMVNGSSYHIEVVFQEKNIKIYINNSLLFDVDDPDYLFQGNEQIILLVTTGSVAPTEVYFDNILVTSEDEDNNDLGVPLIMQTDPLWASEIYNSADVWSPSVPGIGRWGCAMTSAVMVFQSNALTKMPGGIISLTPSSVNSWLKSNSDGYIRNGLVNWLALTRLSRLAAVDNGVSFDALEYSRIGQRDDVALNTSIGSGIPAILDVTNHFVVATGSDSANSTFFINDPFYNRTSLADPAYSKNYLTMGTFTPVNSDLSYMMFVVDAGVNISLANASGNVVGSSYIQDPIKDPMGSIVNSKGPVKIYYYKKPTSGQYTLRLTGQTNSYILEKYLYDVDANVSKTTSTGGLGNGATDTYKIVFDKQSSASSTIAEINFEYVKKEINAYYSQKKIKNFGVYIALLAELEIARKSKSPLVSKRVLDAMIATIRGSKRFIDPGASAVLIADIQLLKNSL